MSGFCQRCFASLSIVSLLLGSHADASETYACRQPVPTDSWVVLAGDAAGEGVSGFFKGAIRTRCESFR
ncbi:MAG: hypothetical protein IPM37_08245 [Hahellaceae bacterium]|nr:hypothetical protein [Hahellaceae bacterium]